MTPVEVNWDGYNGGGDPCGDPRCQQPQCLAAEEARYDPWPHMTTLETILAEKVLESQAFELAIGTELDRCSRCGNPITDWERLQWGAKVKRNRVDQCWLCRRWSRWLPLARPWKKKR